MAGTSTRCSVRLGAGNWLTWSQEFYGILIVNKVHTCIHHPSGRSPFGAYRRGVVDPAVVPKPEPVPDLVGAPDVAADLKCLGLMAMNVGPELSHMVDYSKHAWECWEHLESFFYGSADARMQQYRSDLHEFSLEKDESLGEAGARLGRLAAVGARLGIVMSQTELKATFMDAVCRVYDWGPALYSRVADGATVIDELVATCQGSLRLQLLKRPAAHPAAVRVPQEPPGNHRWLAAADPSGAAN